MSAARTFRVFLSSTFADLEAERNALHQYVFPRLRDLCQRHGARFQAIDLRWGVSQEASLDQQTMEICLAEIARCRRVTPRPNFLVLLGDRYGWCPLPPRVPAEELDALRAWLDAEDRHEDRQLVDDWYKRDDNAVPPEYRLQPRDPNGEYADRAKWGAVEERLHDALAAAAEGLDLPDARRLVYRASATEQEIAAGALQVEAPEDKVFCFFRQIEGLPGSFSGADFVRAVEARLTGEQPLLASDAQAADVIETMRQQVPGRLAREVCGLLANLPRDGSGGELATALQTWLEEYQGKRFLDLDGQSWERDPAAQASLQDLKRSLRQRLPDNVHEYTARWEGFGISDRHIGSLPETLDVCLELSEAQDAPPSLCLDVWRCVSRTILDELEHPSAVLFHGRGDDRVRSDLALNEEGLAHQAFAEERRRHFVGRADALDQISRHIAQTGSGVLVVAGDGGAGKSALLTKAVEEARKAHPNAQIMSRFIGATPTSTDGLSLLNGLIQELERRYGAQQGILSDDFNLLGMDLEKRLALASVIQPLLLFLDALDQLSEANGARDLAWLPVHIPESVRIVVSIRPGEMLDTLAARDLQTTALGAMPRPEGAELLHHWLGEVGRTLQPDQHVEVLDKFESAGGLPLYLRLAFELAQRWTSYQPREILQSTIPAFIRRDLFTRLARADAHGAMLVARALGYLAASRYGLAEDELLDLLSRDVDLYADFLCSARHLPSDIIRSAVNYLEGEKGEVTETEARAWLVELHRSPDRREAFLSEVLKDPNGPRLPIVLWSRLYFDLEPFLAERLSGQDTLLHFFHAELRDAATTTYLDADAGSVLVLHGGIADYFRAKTDPDGRGAWDGGYPRGLSELPYHLTKAQCWQEGFDTLTDFTFMEAKCSLGREDVPGADGKVTTRYTGVDQLITDYGMALMVLAKAKILAKEQAELGVIQEALQLSAHAIRARPSELYAQLHGRLQSRQTRMITRLLSTPRDLPWLRCVNAALTPAGGAILHTALVGTDAKAAIAPNGKMAIICNKAGRQWVVRTWSLGANALSSPVPLGFLTVYDIVAIVPEPESRFATLILKSFFSEFGLVLIDLRRSAIAHSEELTGVKLVSVVPHCRRAVIFSAHGGLRVVDLDTGKTYSPRELRELKDVRFICTSPFYDTAVLVRRNGVLAILDAHRPTITPMTVDEPLKIERTAVTTDGRFAVLFGEVSAMAFDFERESLSSPFSVPRELTSKGELTAVCLIADHDENSFRWRFIRVDNNEVKVWDVAAGWCDGKRNEPETSEHRNHKPGLKIHREILNRLPARLSRSLRVGDEDASEHQHSETAPTHVAKGDFGTLDSIAVSPDGDRLLTGWSDTTVKEWNLESGALIRTLRGHAGNVYSCAFTPDGKRSISLSSDGTIRVWSLTRGGGAGTMGKRRREEDLDETRPDVSLWTQGVHRGTDSDLPNTYVCSLEPTSDGRKVLAVSKDECVSVVNSLSYAETAQLFPGKDRGGPWVHRHRRNKEFHSEPTLRDYFSSRVRTTSDGMKAYVASKGGSIIVWNIWSGMSEATEGIELREQIFGIRDFAFSQDERFLFYVTTDRTVTAIKRSNGKNLGPSGGLETKLLRLFYRLSAPLLVARSMHMFAAPGPLLVLLVMGSLIGSNSALIQELLPLLFVSAGPVLGLMGDDGILCVRFRERLDAGIAMPGRDPPKESLLKCARVVIEDLFDRKPKRQGRALRGQLMKLIEFVSKLLLVPVVLPAELGVTLDMGKPEYVSLWEKIKSAGRLSSTLSLAGYLLRWVFAWPIIFNWLMRDLAVYGRRIRPTVAVLGIAFVAGAFVFTPSSPLLTAVGCALIAFAAVPDVLLAFFTRLDVPPDRSRLMVVSMTASSYRSEIFDARTGIRQHVLDGKACFVGSDTILLINKADLSLLRADTFELIRSIDVPDLSEDEVVLYGSRSGRWLVVQTDDVLRVLNREGKLALEWRGDYSKGVFALEERYLAVVCRSDNTLRVADLRTGKPVASLRTDTELTVCNVMPDERSLIAGDTDGRVYFFWLEGMTGIGEPERR